MKLDFACCSDEFIYDSIGITLSSCLFIPLRFRRSPKLVKEFFWLSRQARDQLEKEDGENICRDDKSSSKTCVHLLRSVMGVGSKVVWGEEEEEEGYDSLIRTIIYKKAQLLKDNRQNEF